MKEGEGYGTIFGTHDFPFLTQQMGQVCKTRHYGWMMPNVVGFYVIGSHNAVVPAVYDTSVSVRALLFTVVIQPGPHSIAAVTFLTPSSLTPVPLTPVSLAPVPLTPT